MTHESWFVFVRAASIGKSAATLNYVRESRAQARRAGATLGTKRYPSRWVGEGALAPSAILAGVWEAAASAAGSALSVPRGGDDRGDGASDLIATLLLLLFCTPASFVRCAALTHRSRSSAALRHGQDADDPQPDRLLIAQGKTVGVVAGANSRVDVIGRTGEPASGRSGRPKIHQREDSTTAARAWAREASTASSGASART